LNELQPDCQSSYRGRLAPSPTGLLHLGHARTFWAAQIRARNSGGVLVLRNEDLDAHRCKPEFLSALIEDLRWFGFEWQEGPDCGGPYGPYNQSERMHLYLAAFERLREGGWVYPCACSRQDVLRALQAPHQGEDEPVYPGFCRPPATGKTDKSRQVNWRFRVPDGQAVSFVDRALGTQSFVAGKDFGDFIVWRHDNSPSYQLAVVVDDSAMRITEAVRGADLLKSTARQLLLYRALNLAAPDFFHCPLMTDQSGARLAKRHDALSLRSMRASGALPVTLRLGWENLHLRNGP
jgi:glutamyl/glutaminyl-tRNA synthetase